MPHLVRERLELQATKKTRLNPPLPISTGPERHLAPCVWAPRGRQAQDSVGELHLFGKGPPVVCTALLGGVYEIPSPQVMVSHRCCCRAHQPKTTFCSTAAQQQRVAATRASSKDSRPPPASRHALPPKPAGCRHHRRPQGPCADNKGHRCRAGSALDPGASQNERFGGG